MYTQVFSIFPHPSGRYLSLIFPASPWSLRPSSPWITFTSLSKHKNINLSLCPLSISQKYSSFQIYFLKKESRLMDYTFSPSITSQCESYQWFCFINEIVLVTSSIILFLKQENITTIVLIFLVICEELTICSLKFLLCVLFLFMVIAI